MAIRLYDTATRGLLELPPAQAEVGMYVCGPTVYQRAHIGNARPFVVFSWLRNWLRERGYDVTYVHNVTDVNDKIYEAAGEGSSAELAKEATAWYLEDVEALGLGMPEEMPKVSLNVPVIVEYIEKLIEAGHAYEVDGDVYFRVSSFPDYGKLSGRWEPPPEPEYPFHDKPVRVTRCGRICMGHRKINLSTVFAGQIVGIREVEDQVWLVSFLDFDLGFFDREEGRVEPAPNPFGPEKVSTMSPE